MTASIWHRIGMQFSHPTGTAGALTGGLMRVMNGGPNRLAIEALQVSAHDTVLELGCGPGMALQTLCRKTTGGVHGIDLSAVMLRQAARRNALQIAGGQLSLYRAAFHELPLQDASIDKVLAVNVVYFWQDALSVLAELRRVMKPGGRMSIYATDASAMRRWPFASPATHRLFDSAGLSDCLRSGPFADSQIQITRADIGFGVTGLVATIDR